MEPLSITTACLALLGAVAKASLDVATFIRGCREARSDLTSISGELTQLQLVLDLLKDDASVSNSQVIPESLQAQILSIIKNCSAVIDSLNIVLQNHSGKTGVVRWVAAGKGEVAGLRMSLEAHRGSLSLVLELVSVSMSKAIMEGMDVVRSDVHDIKQDTRHVPEIMAELTRLRAIVSTGAIPTATSGQNHVLERYLDSLTSYAETVCNDVVWDSDGSRHTLSQQRSRESVSGAGYQNQAHSGGGAAELPTELSGNNLPDISSQSPTAVGSSLGSRRAVAPKASYQVPEVATEQHKEELWVTKRPELHANNRVAPDFAISPVEDPKLSDIDCAPSTSGNEVAFTKKLLIVGDEDVAMFMIYNAFLPRSYEPYPENWNPPHNFVANLKLGEELVKFTLCDFYFLEAYHPRTAPENQKPDAALICYAIDSPDTLSNVEKWSIKVRQYSAPPIILVGLKKDSRKNSRVIAELARTGKRAVTYQEGELFARKIGALKYLECSSNSARHVGGDAMKLALGMLPKFDKFWPVETEILAPGIEIELPEPRKTRKGRLGDFLRKIVETK